MRPVRLRGWQIQGSNWLANSALIAVNPSINMHVVNSVKGSPNLNP
jgi:hypothetical protein